MFIYIVSVCVYIHVCVCVLVCACMCSTVHASKSEDKFMKLVLSFHIYSNPRNETQVTKPPHWTQCSFMPNIYKLHPCASQILLSSLLNNAIELCNPHHGANIIFITVINFIYLSFLFVVSHGRFAVSRAYHKINKQYLVNGHKNNSF